jgi:UDP-N-acetylbacillosamine transaminase
MYNLENNFDNWNELKKNIHNIKEVNINIKERNIYFVSMGQNIGRESYGKGEKFLRPVLVYKKLGSRYFLGIPLTSTLKEGSYYFAFNRKNGKKNTAMLNQMKTFDAKRVVSYAGKISNNVYKNLQNKMGSFMNITLPEREGVPTRAKDDCIIPKNENSVNQRLFLSPPHMGRNELTYIEKVFQSNYIAPLGEYVNKFEESISQYTGAKHALAVTSGTAAIHLALRVLGIGKGDDVLASSFTFIGSVNAILYQGANPVFIDSDYVSWNLSPELLSDYLATCKKRPKALIVTHLYGQSADIEKIATICKSYGVYLIEDAAESLGATYNGRHTGTFGDFGIYSFNGNKILTTSGGGVLVSHNEAWIEKAKFLSTQAKEPFLHYEHEEYGYNYRMSNVLAAIGVGQMEVIEERVAKKREIFTWYQEALEGLPVAFMPELENSRGNRWLTTLLFEENIDIHRVIDALEQQNCESRPLWKPMHMQPLFKEALCVNDGVSEALFKRGLCLPSGTKMSREDIQRVTSAIRGSL